ncbi:ABC transporter E family member [Acrasis kona]|uniref:ABC transporter E family member n=1 Tax=Acrasis kona TaxID=1008807 RepID=A0AAW2ZGJ1_9EUKA
MPTIEVGHAENAIPRSFMVNEDGTINKEDFKIEIQYERSTVVKVAVSITLVLLLFLVYTIGAVIGTIFVDQYAPATLLEAISIFCIWFVWLGFAVTLSYCVIRVALYSWNLREYNRKKRASRNIAVVAMAPAIVDATSAPGAKSNAHESVRYSSGLNHVNSMAGIYFGRENSADFRDMITKLEADPSGDSVIEITDNVNTPSSN